MASGNFTIKVAGGWWGVAAILIVALSSIAFQSPAFSKGQGVDDGIFWQRDGRAAARLNSAMRQAIYVNILGNRRECQAGRDTVRPGA